MMVTFFEGIKYNYKIISDKIAGNKYSWTLRAIYKVDKSYSGINNLNIILSELFNEDESELELNPDRFEDSSGWILTEKVMNTFNKTIQSLIKDRESLKYLEDEIDEDRNCGEWENVEL